MHIDLPSYPINCKVLLCGKMSAAVAVTATTPPLRAGDGGGKEEELAKADSAEKCEELVKSKMHQLKFGEPGGVTFVPDGGRCFAIKGWQGFGTTKNVRSVSNYQTCRLDKETIARGGDAQCNVPLRYVNMVSDGMGDLGTLVRRGSKRAAKNTVLRDHYPEVVEELYRLGVHTLDQIQNLDEEGWDRLKLELGKGKLKMRHYNVNDLRKNLQSKQGVFGTPRVLIFDSINLPFERDGRHDVDKDVMKEAKFAHPFVKGETLSCEVTTQEITLSVAQLRACAIDPKTGEPLRTSKRSKLEAAIIRSLKDGTCPHFRGMTVTLDQTGQAGPKIAQSIAQAIAVDAVEIIDGNPAVQGLTYIGDEVIDATEPTNVIIAVHDRADSNMQTTDAPELMMSLVSGDLAESNLHKVTRDVQFKRFVQLCSKASSECVLTVLRQRCQFEAPFDAWNKVHGFKTQDVTHINVEKGVRIGLNIGITGKSSKAAIDKHSGDLNDNSADL